MLGWRAAVGLRGDIMELEMQTICCVQKPAPVEAMCGPSGSTYCQQMLDMGLFNESANDEELGSEQEVHHDIPGWVRERPLWGEADTMQYRTSVIEYKFKIRRAKWSVYDPADNMKMQHHCLFACCYVSLTGLVVFLSAVPQRAFAFKILLFQNHNFKYYFLFY